MYALNHEERKVCALQTEWESMRLERLANAQYYKVNYAEMERDSQRNKAKNAQDHSDFLARKSTEKKQQAPQPTDSVPPMGIRWMSPWSFFSGSNSRGVRSGEEYETNNEEAQINTTNSVQGTTENPKPMQETI